MKWRVQTRCKEELGDGLCIIGILASAGRVARSLVSFKLYLLLSLSKEFLVIYRTYIENRVESRVNNYSKPACVGLLLPVPCILCTLATESNHQRHASVHGLAVGTRTPTCHRQRARAQSNVP